MRRGAVCLVVALAIIAGTSGSAVAATKTITLGLPDRLLPASPVDPDALDRLVRDHLGQLCGSQSECARRAGQLQINIALGSDYEILDWFGKGLLDIAVVPDLGARLLRDDRLQFLDLELGRGQRVSAGGAGAPEHLARFAETVWCGARTRTQGWDVFLALVTGRVEKPPACSEPSSTAATLSLPSHFHGFVEAVDAGAAWLAPRLGPWQPSRCRDTARAALEDGFWKEFFRRTRFTLTGAPELRVAGDAIPLSTLHSGDRLIIVDSAVRRLRIRSDGRADVPLPASVAELWGRQCGDGREAVRQVPPAFRPIATIEGAFGVRTFGFTPAESVELLRAHLTRGQRIKAVDGAAEPVELALVLPGGGVKAAYQTVLLEKLYRAGMLRNRGVPSPADARAAALDVDYVIGTSGGALLGYFAARLNRAGPWGLDSLLWQRCGPEPCRDIQSTDIFAYIDMPRYLSLVAILAMFAAIMYMFGPEPRPDQAAQGARGRWRFFLFLSIGLPLLVLPFLIREVNGEAGREHVPEVEGLIYMLCVLVAMFADQCLLLLGDGDPPERRGRWRTAGMLLAAAGVGAVMIPALQRKYSVAPTAASWLDHPITMPIAVFGRYATIHAGALLVSGGGLVMLAGLVIWITQRRGYRFHDVPGFRRGFTVGVVHLVLSSFLIYLIVVFSPVTVTLLELTLQYWIALVLASAVVAALLLLARRISLRPKIVGVIARGTEYATSGEVGGESAEQWLRRRVVQVALEIGRFIGKGIDYLTGAHPSGGLTSRRLARFTVQAALAVSWWNLVLAPAMYGNQLALALLRDSDQRFGELPPEANRAAKTLKVPLIVTANVLEADGARYFAFLPRHDACLRLTRRSGYGATWRVFSPGSPGNVPEPARRSSECYRSGDLQWTDANLRDIVFASGSPYPVFAAHAVAELTGGKKIRLVDGGYASNVPLDAAQAVGADAVLIVESTNPLGHASAPWSPADWLDALRGDLVRDAPLLFGFLWERSQELDKISRRELLVVSLAPSRDHADWPTLVEFTPGVISRMRRAAAEDWNESRRIAMVQSWGRPRLAYTVLPASARLSKR